MPLLKLAFAVFKLLTFCLGVSHPVALVPAIIRAMETRPAKECFLFTCFH
jgi:hypothetical protein